MEQKKEGVSPREEEQVCSPFVAKLLAFLHPVAWGDEPKRSSRKRTSGSYQEDRAFYNALRRKPNKTTEDVRKLQEFEGDFHA